MAVQTPHKLSVVKLVCWNVKYFSNFLENLLVWLETLLSASYTAQFVNALGNLQTDVCKMKWEVGAFDGIVNKTDAAPATVIE